MTSTIVIMNEEKGHVKTLSLTVATDTTFPSSLLYKQNFTDKEISFSLDTDTVWTVHHSDLHTAAVTNTHRDSSQGSVNLLSHYSPGLHLDRHRLLGVAAVECCVRILLEWRIRLVSITLHTETKLRTLRDKLSECLFLVAYQLPSRPVGQTWATS